MSDQVVVPSLGIALRGQQPVTPETEGHWRAAAQGQFTVPTCSACATPYWPVVNACYACGSADWSWQPVAGSGKVYTYTWMDMPTHDIDELQNIAVIEIDDTEGEPIRVPGWVVGVDKTTLVCGLPVVAAFDEIAEGLAVPHWRPS